jgi:bacillithiol biosynthesis cysteine-adding enzyme BshC
MFSQLIQDYLQEHAFVHQFVAHSPDLKGIEAAIQERKKFATNRTLVQRIFQDAYASQDASPLQQQNMDSLTSENTFTLCTAHQPNIFTGYLYFIYKTAHVVALAKQLNDAYPSYHFVPVFYIGSEDNDLDELSRFKLHGKSFQWETQQTGAVGRMQADEGVAQLIDAIEKELVHLPFAHELISLLRKAYAIGNDMAEGTFVLLNALFRDQGLLVLQPDNPALKGSMKQVFRDDLLNNTAEKVVGKTNALLEQAYKLQVNPRSVNLFYLRDGIRNRIDKRGNTYSVDGTVIRFSEVELLEELEQYPERFSPNVILRGLYQETILPNILFVGGGSEVAYWMQLKELFHQYSVPYPVLVLRNSFMIMDAHHGHKMKELAISDIDLFKEETVLANELVQRWAGTEISLSAEEKQSKELFHHLKKRASEVDKTLVQHVHALEVFHLKRLETLEKKMLKAERKKQSTQLQRIWKLKAELFPNNGLQERVDNFMPYYAQYGKAFIDLVLQHSQGLEQQFGIIEVKEQAPGA